MAVEFVVLHQERPLMLAQGKYAETTTRLFVKNMQYSSLYAPSIQWVKEKYLADSDDILREEQVCHHSCRRTMAVNDASIKSLTAVLVKRYPPDEGAQQQVMNRMEDLIWVGACFVWQMVDNILRWLEKAPAEQTRLMYDGVEPAIGRTRSMRQWEPMAKDCDRLGRLPIDIDSGDDTVVWHDYITLAAKHYYWSLTLLEFKAIPLAYQIAMYKRSFYDTGKPIPHRLPPLLTKELYDKAYEYASSREHAWQREEEHKLWKARFTCSQKTGFVDFSNVSFTICWVRMLN